VKLTEEYEKELSADVFTTEIDKRLKSYNTTCSTSGGPWGHLGAGQTQRETMLMVSDKTSTSWSRSSRRSRSKASSVPRHLRPKPKVFRKVLNNYPQFSVILFPYLFLTRNSGRQPPRPGEGKDVG